MLFTVEYGYAFFRLTLRNKIVLNNKDLFNIRIVMKAKKRFTLRNVCGEYIIVAEGKENIDFSNIISLNESSAYLWKKIQNMDSFSIEDLAKFLMEEYDVDMETAIADSKSLAKQWVSIGIVIE